MLNAQHAAQDVQIAQHRVEHKYAQAAKSTLDFQMELAQHAKMEQHRQEELPNVQYVPKDALNAQQLMEHKLAPAAQINTDFPMVLARLA